MDKFSSLLFMLEQGEDDAICAFNVSLLRQYSFLTEKDSGLACYKLSRILANSSSRLLLRHTPALKTMLWIDPSLNNMAVATLRIFSSLAMRLLR